MFTGQLFRTPNLGLIKVSEAGGFACGGGGYRREALPPKCHKAFMNIKKNGVTLRPTASIL